MRVRGQPLAAVQYQRVEGESASWNYGAIGPSKVETKDHRSETGDRPQFQNPNSQIPLSADARRNMPSRLRLFDPKSKMEWHSGCHIGESGVRSRKPEVRSLESEEKPAWNQWVGGARWNRRSRKSNAEQSAIDNRKSTLRKGVIFCGHRRSTSHRDTETQRRKGIHSFRGFQ